MKHNLFKFTLAFLFCLSLSGLQAQNMYITTTTGAQAAYDITKIQKLTFSGDNLLVTPKSGVVTTHPISGNLYINFTNLTLSTPVPQRAATAFYVYPNPVTDVLNISIEEQGQPIDDITIITLDGSMVLQQNPSTNPTQQIAVSTLPLGIYLCKITSANKTQTLKFIKQ
jgi:hypothetical protein